MYVARLYMTHAQKGKMHGAHDQRVWDQQKTHEKALFLIKHYILWFFKWSISYFKVKKKKVFAWGPRSSFSGLVPCVLIFPNFASSQMEQTVKNLFLLWMQINTKCLLFGFRFGSEILLLNPLECIVGFLWGERGQETYWLILN